MKIRNIIITLGTAVLPLFWQSAKAVVKDPPPNIILIVTDDQGYGDLSAYRHAADDCHTPQMDRIARSGVLFTHAYAAAPVCSPARAGMLTGKYQQRWDPDMYWSPGLPLNVPTLAELLKTKADYVTAKIGKSDWGTNFHRTGVREFPRQHGYDYFLGFSAHAHDYLLLDEAVEKATPDPYGWSESLGRLYRDTTKESFPGAYTTTLFTDAAIDFIKKHRSRPFFLDLSYNAVHHLIHELPQAYLDKWKLPKIPDYNPAQGSYAHYYLDYTQVGKITDEAMRRYYLANLNCLDDNIGRLLDLLEQTGLFRNTLIIFTSDNGGAPLTGASNQPLSGAKYSMYEGGLRVPFMMSWPAKLPQKLTYNHRVSAFDIVPTCLQAAGVSGIEGLDFDGAPILDAVRKGIPSAAAGSPLFFKFEKQYSVIDDGWKLAMTNNYNPPDRPISSRILLGLYENQPALYELRRDPSEQVNLIKTMPAKAKRLQVQLAGWLQDMQADSKRYQFQK